MRALKLWPIEQLALKLYGGAGAGCSQYWLCAGRNTPAAKKSTWLNFEIYGTHSVLSRRVGTAAKLKDLDIINLVHMSKGKIVFLSQLWSEFAVREETVIGRISQNDIIGVRKKARLLELIALYPKFLAYLLKQPEFAHVIAIKLPVDDGVYYVTRHPEGMHTVVINALFNKAKEGLTPVNRAKNLPIPFL